MADSPPEEENSPTDMGSYMKYALSRSLLEMSLQLPTNDEHDEVTIDFGALPEGDEFDDDILGGVGLEDYENRLSSPSRANSIIVKGDGELLGEESWELIDGTDMSQAPDAADGSGFKDSNGSSSSSSSSSRPVLTAYKVRSPLATAVAVQTKYSQRRSTKPLGVVHCLGQE